MFRRVQELLTTTHDGCELDRILKKRQCEKDEKSARVEEDEEEGSVTTPLIEGLDS